MPKTTKAKKGLPLSAMPQKAGGRRCSPWGEAIRRTRQGAGVSNPVRTQYRYPGEVLTSPNLSAGPARTVALYGVTNTGALTLYGVTNTGALKKQPKTHQSACKD